MKNLYWQFVTRIKLLKNWQIPAWIDYVKIQYCTKFSRIKNKVPPTRSVFLLVWEFPPQVLGGVYRPMSWTKYAKEANWILNVLCCEAPATPSTAGIELEHSIPKHVKVHRVLNKTLGPHPSPLPNIDGGLRNAMEVFKAAQTLMKTEMPSVILASGPPFHNFLAGAWLAEQYGCPLVLDYRDEWTASPLNFVLKDQVNSRIEKNCLSKADLVVFTTESQRLHAIRTFSEINESKSVVVTNGWEPQDFAFNYEVLQSNEITKKESTITIAYLGNLGPMADPEPFLSALERILDASPKLQKQLKFKCIGIKSQSAKAQLNNFKYQNNLELIDQIPKMAACQTMKSVDFLLILNPPTIHHYIQGKLYEYIASGTPILVFGKGGEMADIVSELNTGIVIDSRDERELSDILNNEKLQLPLRNYAKIEQWLKSRQRKTLAIKMFEQLDKMMNNNSKKNN